MMKHLKIALLAGSVLALSACGDEWRVEAGSSVDEGGFGNPTMNNTQVQNGDILFDLNSRFAQQVPTMVNFDFDKAVLDEQSKAVLRQQADWIKQFPEVRFSVFGHTDLVGSAEYNRRLGQRRAQAVVNYLVTQGVERDRLEALVSFGKTQPLVVTNDRERRNRRTVTEVSGFIQSASGPLDGKYADVIYREYVASATELPPVENQGLERIAGQGE